MRRVFVGLLAASALGLVSMTGPTARSAEAVCCDIWIFDPAGGKDAYALRVRRGGGDVVALPGADGAFSLLQGGAARGEVRRWIAASQRKSATSVLIDARESQFHIGDGADEPPDDDPEADPDIERGDTLILIRHASARQSRAFIDEIPGLRDADRAEMKAAVPAR